MRRALAAAALAALLLAGCATDRVLLLADEDGTGTGALAVIDGKDERDRTVIDQPLTQASLRSASASVRQVKRVGEADSRLLASLPPPPASFTLYFPQGATSLTQESRPVLEAIRAEIARRPGAEVQVTGHTDTVDSEERNDRLSQDRAEAVVRQLAVEGFPMEILSAVGRGERELLEKTADNVPSEANRRVEVIVR